MGIREYFFLYGKELSIVNLSDIIYFKKSPTHSCKRKEHIFYWIGSSINNYTKHIHYSFFNNTNSLLWRWYVIHKIDLINPRMHVSVCMHPYLLPHVRMRSNNAQEHSFCRHWSFSHDLHVNLRFESFVFQNARLCKQAPPKWQIEQLKQSGHTSLPQLSIWWTMVASSFQDPPHPFSHTL